MKIAKLKKLVAVSLALALALSASVLAGCGSSDATDKGSSNGSSVSADAKQELIFNLGEDPKTIDPTLNTTNGGGTIVGNAFEGLCRLDENDKAKEGLAESWVISEDGLTYTFKLREGLKWSDGSPLTAKDFEYSWKRALNPATGAEYAYQLYYIKGAEEYNTKGGAVEDVAIKAIDETTLEVQLVSPTPYFLELMAFATYFPVKEEVVEGNDAWATKPETYISNGPFKLVEWRMKDALVFEKNEHYWNAENVKLEKLEMRMITEETSAYASFQSGQVDMLNSLPTQEIQNAVANGTGQIFPQVGTYFYVVNVSGEGQTLTELQEAKVRQALNMAIDRTAIVENVTKGEQTPATSFVAPSVLGEDGKPFTKEYFPADGDAEKAKELLAEAGFPEGKGLPTIQLIYNTEGAHGDVAQAIQSMWKEIGVNVELQNQEWKVFLDTRKNFQYEIARHGWVGDYVDPMTFLDLWVTGGGNNAAGYSNAEYDALVTGARNEADTAKRQEMLNKAEDILMADMPVIPIYYYTQPKAIQTYVKGVTVNQLGKVCFADAYIEK